MDNSLLRTTDNVRYYHSQRYNSSNYLDKNQKMHGVKRVIVFCILIVILPATLIIIPLYLRHNIFRDVVFKVAESDILEIRDGISSIFCEYHSLKMDTNFNAFQLSGKPEISTNRKHIRLKKSMVLPDDTLEYWGFYLLKGAIVQLKFCSRYDGARILVVKGERNLQTCGLLEHNKNKFGANFAQGHEKVKVTFEDKEEFNMSKEKKLQNPENNDTNFLNNDHNFTTNTRNDMEFENHGGENFNNENENDNKTIQTGNTTNIQLNTTTNSSSLISTTPSTIVNNTLNEKLMNIRKRNHHIKKYSGHDRSLLKRPKRHLINNQQYNYEYEKKRENIINNLYNINQLNRQKRDQIYDRKISHGGNALNFTEKDESNSISSFENSLLSCYDGNILLAEGFSPSAQCLNVHFLTTSNGSHMSSKHEVVQDGYYYYIFYSDNDLVRNDIHAIFDIYKPTFQYSNITKKQSSSFKNSNDITTGGANTDTTTKTGGTTTTTADTNTVHTNHCINSTHCSFPLRFYSNEYVIVEVPTRDGIEHEEDDISYLISTCHPRMSIYMIFPILILILILSCSFL